MVYALNLYDIIHGEEATYRQYVKLATQQLKGIDAKPICSGTNPIRSLKGNARQHMLVMQFGDEKDFDLFMHRLEEQNLHMLRESSTENYIWTLFDNWDLKKWAVNHK
ncbi:hypothetical protein [Aliiglaciecola litoralis]|uniref:DUF1330 domain-containing protein n=1 Tax=Aliiglaciecola litoralis TaxID=582857 RepID=A0ABN1LF89_9ALTE